MYEDLKGKNALVTGSGKKTGIGYAIAEKLARNGANVIITDLGDANADCGELAPGARSEMEEIAVELNSRYGVQTMAVNVDVTKRESVDGMVEEVKKKFDRIDILCNNAGATFGVPAGIPNYDETAWIRTVDVNLHGVLRVTQAVLPMMGEGGSIINTASRAGKCPPLFNGAYAVAKAGVIMFTKVLAKEIAGRGIRVNAICPGQIMTDLERWRFNLEAEVMGCTFEDRVAEMCKTIPLNRIGDPEETGALVAFLASKESSYLTGQAINVDGGQLMEL